MGLEPGDEPPSLSACMGAQGSKQQRYLKFDGQANRGARIRFHSGPVPVFARFRGGCRHVAFFGRRSAHRPPDNRLVSACEAAAGWVSWSPGTARFSPACREIGSEVAEQASAGGDPVIDPERPLRGLERRCVADDHRLRNASSSGAITSTVLESVQQIRSAPRPRRDARGLPDRLDCAAARAPTSRQPRCRGLRGIRLVGVGLFGTGCRHRYPSDTHGIEHGEDRAHGRDHVDARGLAQPSKEPICRTGHRSRRASMGHEVDGAFREAVRTPGPDRALSAQSRLRPESREAVTGRSERSRLPA